MTKPRKTSAKKPRVSKADPFQETDVSVARMTDEYLKKFVRDYMGNDIFTHFQIKGGTPIEMVFMPLAFGATAGFTKAKIDTIGCIYARYSEGTFPRAVNGYPIFGSCAFMHKDDWARAHAAITKARDALENIDV
jgi:hypothetical protein